MHRWNCWSPKFQTLPASGPPKTSPAVPIRPQNPNRKPRTRRYPKVLVVQHRPPYCWLRRNRMTYAETDATATRTKKRRRVISHGSIRIYRVSNTVGSSSLASVPWLCKPTIHMSYVSVEFTLTPGLWLRLRLATNILYMWVFPRYWHNINSELTRLVTDIRHIYK